MLVGAAASLLVGACAGNSADSGDSAKEPTSTSVTVKDFAFGPKQIRVQVGQTVTWTNKDSFDHSVQIDSLNVAGPKFGPQTAPATFAHRFDKSGTYSYVCGVHNSMTGTVIVTPRSA